MRAAKQKDRKGRSIRRSAAFCIAILLLTGCGEASDQPEVKKTIQTAQSIQEDSGTEATGFEEAAEKVETGLSGNGTESSPVRELAVASPVSSVGREPAEGAGEGSIRELPAVGDVNYHLEVLRQAKWDWTTQENGTVLYRGKTYKRKSNVKALLGMGVDTHRSLEEQGLTKDERGVCDAIMLAARDKTANTLKVLMIPRNVITEISFYDEKTDEFQVKDMNFLGTAYSQRDSAKDGCTNMVQAVEEMLCGLRIDQYALISLEALPALSDLVGGVTVTIPNEEMALKYPDWTKGKQVTLRGADTERFLRYRSMDESLEYRSALVRLGQHGAFLKGFMEAFKKESERDSGVAVRLYDALEENMITNMQKGELLRLAADGVTGSFSKEDIVTAPGEYEAREYMEYYIDYEALLPLVLEWFYREV